MARRGRGGVLCGDLRTHLGEIEGASFDGGLELLAIDGGSDGVIALLDAQAPELLVVDLKKGDE